MTYNQLEQTRSEVVDLHARVAQSCDRDDRVTDTQPGPDGKPQQIDSARGDVLPQIAWPDRMPDDPQLIEEFGVDEEGGGPASTAGDGPIGRGGGPVSAVGDGPDGRGGGPASAAGDGSDGKAGGVGPGSSGWARNDEARPWRRA